MLYRIERITNCAGEDREDCRSLARIGREGHLMPIAADEPMAFVYAEPNVGTLQTSGVVWIRPTQRGITVRTHHSIYYLSEVEARDNVWPEPIDREDEDEAV